MVKNMNEILKKTILETIKKSNVEIIRKDNTIECIAKDASGKVLITYERYFEYNTQRLVIDELDIVRAWNGDRTKRIPGTIMDLFEIQKALFMRVQKQHYEQARKNSLTTKESAAANFLVANTQKTR
jgi:hypothetical protein